MLIISGWLDELGFFHPATYGNHANVLRKVLKNQNVENFIKFDSYKGVEDVIVDIGFVKMNEDQKKWLIDSGAYILSDFQLRKINELI